MHVVSSTLYLRDRCLRRIGRRDSRLLGLAVVLSGNLSALRLPHGLRLLVLFSLFLLLVPGPILGPDLLVLWDEESEKFCKKIWKLNKALLLISPNSYDDPILIVLIVIAENY
jgi:hypothetical protein